MTLIKSTVNEKLIISLATDSKIYELGKEIFLDDAIKTVREEKTVNGGTIKFEVSDDELDSFNTTIKVDHAGTVKGYGCTCVESLDYFGACQHVIASLFYLLDVNNNKGTRIKTDYITKELTDKFKNIFATENTNSFTEIKNKKFVALIPTINFTSSKKIYLTFRIGMKIGSESIKNHYVIKNLNDFLKNIEQHNYCSYGKDLSFVHNIKRFDDESQKIISMLQIEKSNIDDTTKIISKNNSLIKNNNFPNGKELYVSKEGFDKLIDIFIGDEVTPFNCIDQIPPIKFQGLVMENKLILNKPNLDFFVFIGNSYGYTIVENTIYRTPTNCGLCLAFLQEAYAQTQNKYIHFKKDAINDFFSFILPILTKFGLMEGNYLKDFYDAGYLPLESKMFLDMDKNNIIGKLSFHYGDSVINYGEESYYNGFRDALKEEEILEILSFYGFVFEEESFILKIEDDIFQFYKYGIHRLNELCNVFVTNKFKEKQFLGDKFDAIFSVKITEDLLEMKINESKYTLSELKSALESFKIGKKYYRLKSGNFLDLTDEDVKTTMSMVTVLKNDIKNNEILVNKNKAFFINDLLSTVNLQVSKDQSFENLINKINDIKNREMKFTDYLDKTLRNYQKEGVCWLKGLVDIGFGAILADEMGLGKTIEIIGLIEMEKLENNKPYLIICPTSLIYNWKHEFQKFSPDQKVELITGKSSDREEKIQVIENNCVYISTYDMVKRDISFYENVDFRYVILDEAQNIKNPQTISAKAVKKLKCDNGIALTGTPIENSLKELWSIFDFIMPGYFGSLSEFHNTYGAPIMGENDADTIKLLRKQISPFILRRFKKDVLKELPDKIETVMYADMTQEQEISYSAFFKACKGEILEYEDLSQINIIRKLTRLRQLSCHPSLFLENYNGGSGKLDMTIETIKNSVSEGHRILLFSQFTSMLSIIMSQLTESGFDYFYLDGSTKSKDRELMCARFNSGEKDIFLISLKAGGTGLNLTGADVVIHYDPWWNPSVMNQASDRAHRFGQKKVVQIFNIITKDTIEEKIYNLQQKKKELIDNVLTDEVTHINNLSKDELRNLFLD